MTSPHPNQDKTITAPPPRMKNKSRISLVWLIPLITALIGGWLIIKTLTEQGPQITITFKTAEGIEAGKTKIKYKEIEIGVVDSVHFSPDFSHIILKVSMAKEAKLFLRRDTRFWVVKPRLSLRGVSNIGTLVSGVYIEIEPGQGVPRKHFVGLDTPPVVKADVAGRKIILISTRLGSIDTGSPVSYQGILAGEILGWELGNDRKSIFIHAFIKSPYDELVKSNSRFWNVSGMDVSLGSDNVKVHMESVQSFLLGGIAFETPDTLKPGKEDLEGLVFTLYDNYESIKEHAFTKKMAFILFFDGSVRGLNIGAPVEFKGIKVGSVVDVHLEFDKRDSSFRIPVRIEIEPERIIEQDAGNILSPYETLKDLVDRGLRAQLQSGSLITGQLFVELDMHPDTPVRLVQKSGSLPELPTIPASIEQMTTSVKNFLARIEKIEFNKISEELLKTLEGTNRLITNPEIENIIGELNTSLHALKTILVKLDQHIGPFTDNMEKVIADGGQTIQKAQITLEQLNQMLKPNAPIQYRFYELTEELAETARSIRTLVDILERKPNAVLFGKEPSKKE